ncbi:MAG: twin-arginine translocase TatA/TatE family subunit [Hyphomicrobiaceae bacterium]|nr:twin-arginine translocase TatA/TatE family subunit [Hyphomicrobiaceae bacterium]
MGSLSVWHWLIFLAVALLFFGGSGKISAVMGDFAKGIKSFKKGLQDDADEAKAAEQAKALEAQKTPGVQPTGTGTKVG